MTKLYTACWFAPIPEDHIRIGISRGTPRGFPAGYRKFKLLMPGPWFNSVDPRTYIDLFNREILMFLEPEQVVKEIDFLGCGKVPVMCCYEHAPKIQTGEQYCHRHMVAQWLEDRLSIEVPELDHPNLDRFAHFRKLGIPAPTYKRTEPPGDLLAAG
jgi:hypothetical protein